MTPRQRRRAATAILGTLVVLALLAGGYTAYRVWVHGGYPWSAAVQQAGLAADLGTQHTEALLLDIEVDPQRGHLKAEARWHVQQQKPGAPLRFLLNPGLEIRSATIAGEEAAVRRSGRYASLQPHTTEAVEVVLRYEGVPTGDAPDAPLAGDGEWVLLPGALWYPNDLNSFFAFQCRITAPEGWQVVQAERVGGVWSWHASRPINGAALCVGRYVRAERRYGGALFRVHSPPRLANTHQHLLDLAVQAHAALTRRFDDNGFETVDLMVCGAARHDFYGGASLGILGARRPDESPPGLHEVARLLARAWWGGTVGGRWYPARPEGAAFLTAGMAEYSAWEVVRGARGRPDWLPAREAISVPLSPRQPLASYGMADLAAADVALPEVERYAPAVATLLRAHLGEETFEQGCRNFLAVHRHRTASLDAWAHELELAAESDLEALVEQWFERSAPCDFGIERVEVGPSSATLHIVNEGRRTAPGPIDVAVVTSEGVRLHAVYPGVRGGVFPLEFTGEFHFAYLDPDHLLPDGARANNCWPRCRVPLGVQAYRGGAAILATEAWPSPRAEWLVPQGGASPQRFAPPASAVYAAEHGLVVRMGRQWQWVDEGPTQPLAAPDDRYGGEAHGLFWFWREHRWYPGDLRGNEQRPPARAPAPMLGSLLPFGADSIVYVARDSGRLLRLAAHSGETRELAPEFSAVGLPARSDAGAAVFVSSAGEVVGVAERADAIPTVLRTISGAPGSAVFAPGAAHIAWLDSTGGVVWGATDTAEAERLAVGGAVVDFAWSGPTHLAVLTAEVDAALPLMQVAEYRLVLVDVSSGEQSEEPWPPAS